MAYLWSQFGRSEILAKCRPAISRRRKVITWATALASAITLQASAPAWAGFVTLSGPLSGTYSYADVDVVIYNGGQEVAVISDVTVVVHRGRIIVDALMRSPVTNGSAGEHGSNDEQPTSGGDGASAPSVTLVTEDGEDTGTSSGDIVINASIILHGGQGGDGGSGFDLPSETSTQSGGKAGTGGGGGDITMQSYGDILISTDVGLSTLGGVGGRGGSGGDALGCDGGGTGAPAGHGGAGGSIKLSLVSPADTSSQIRVGENSQLITRGGGTLQGGDGGDGQAGGGAGGYLEGAGAGGWVVVESLGDVVFEFGSMVDTRAGETSFSGAGGSSGVGDCECTGGPGGEGGAGLTTPSPGGSMLVCALGLIVDFDTVTINTSGGADGDTQGSGRAGRTVCSGVTCQPFASGPEGSVGGSAGFITISSGWGVGLTDCAVVGVGGDAGDGGNAGAGVGGGAPNCTPGPEGASGGAGGQGGAGAVVTIEASRLISVGGTTFNLDGGRGGRGGDGSCGSTSGAPGPGGDGGTGGSRSLSAPTILGASPGNLSHDDGEAGAPGGEGCR